MNWVNSGYLILILFSWWALYEFYFRILEYRRRKHFFRYFGKDFIPEAFPMENAQMHILKNTLITRTRPAPIIGWTMLPNANNGVVWTDNDGFRNDNNLDLQNKTVVAVFGGSTALGSMASDNHHTITGRLQHYLQKEYGDKVVVLNLGQPSFTMIQEVCLFSLLADKLNLKISIFIDGHNDVNSVLMQNPKFFGLVGPFFGGWTKSAGIIKSDTFFKTGLRFLCQFSYVAKHARILYWKFSQRQKNSDTQHLNKDFDTKEVVQSFVDLAKVVRGRIRGSGRFALMTLQPVLYDREHKSDPEKKFILQFSQERINFWRECYKNLRKELYARPHSYYFSNKVDDNIIMADFTRITEQLNQTIFVDDCHLADMGNDLYAWNIFTVIKQQGWLNKNTL